MADNENIKDAFDMSQHDHKHVSTTSKQDELEEAFDISQHDQQDTSTMAGDNELQEAFDISAADHTHFYTLSNDDETSEWEDIPYPGYSGPPQDTTPDLSQSRSSSPPPDLDPATKLIISRLTLLGQHSDFRPCIAALRRRTDWVTGQVLEQEVFANVDEAHVYSSAPASDTSSISSGGGEGEGEREKQRRRVRSGSRSRRSSPERVLQQKQALRLKESLEL